MKFPFFGKWIRVKVVMLAVFLTYPLEAEIQTIQPKFPLTALYATQAALLGAYLFGEWRRDKKYNKEKQGEKEKENDNK